MSKLKVKMLTKNTDVYLRETKRDIFKVPRNYDPSLHPFEVPREYVKAMNAVKLERVFAKPFIGNLDGHKDGISCLAKHPKSLSLLLSGAYDGEIRLWNLARKECVMSIQAHEGYIRGVEFMPDGEHYITVGDDNNIKIWETNPSDEDDIAPTDTVISKTVLTGISHHRRDALYATCGETCQIWEETRSAPIKTFQWGVDSLNHVAFNPIETSLLASCASDRSIILYDIRTVGAVRKVVMKMRMNEVSWNPMEAFIFTGACEDYNLYTFDTRQFKFPLYVHKDNTSAVTCVDYSPTGKEFACGGYDKTIRIYEADKTHSREIYHTKRMQRLTTIAWSLDNKYILSGSDEMNVRIWKARAWEKLGVLQRREKTAFEYNEVLKSKFSAHPQIARIRRHRQVPKHVYNAKKELRAATQKIMRKEANRRKHSKPGTVPIIPEKERNFIRAE
ncbi:UNVERIFIED_CONTAM: hypothetical protein PYX00_005804 [Menopon gallinae]|uniref:DDB1- and CUL4-associated factor 13 n=1 Tax=Menopon gallinae TaxID=328185 RepID=A0AAW2HSX2_9NEOP